MGIGQVRRKKLFPETPTDKIFEKDFSFHVKQRTTGKVKFLFSMSLLIVWGAIIFGGGLGARL